VCRILYLPDVSILAYDPLVLTLHQMEADSGGDGWGVGWFEEGVPHVVKGMTLTPIEIAEVAKIIAPGTPVIYHTRKRSNGPLDDESTQPFIVTDGDLGLGLLAHNGTAPSLTSERECDSHRIARLIDEGDTTLARFAEEVPDFGVVTFLGADGRFVFHHCRATEERHRRPFEMVVREVAVGGERRRVVIGISRPQFLSI
jgi:predicted glutamine amidotransferase